MLHASRRYFSQLLKKLINPNIYAFHLSEQVGKFVIQQIVECCQLDLSVILFTRSLASVQVKRWEKTPGRK